ncbi:glucose-1-phosphate adenylyltransferase subunit GlgD [Paenibacillus aurantius]|uniref:Glucose-1-phosphate adenylyltransferase subunit GlgD n=1 Tax=Paenibacillus aurantius TaxID=2918900 RepID=A0AA96RFP1_9BACL|nr:glucose-1-phosphate adenylyltransferase subunit GlgD [Paenibacillus aurantius]WJH34132.1 glucose-1-phosphate adenylyltransferase subunit GlgD [Paenibacillus sp. CC-CFT747]WNQ09209.1 glucose-1-phosphate adenylyltransferase subunit GlgD [Paenibacillus aurantius]
MKDVMGVINLVNELDDMEELTYNRAVASVPFGGRYRLIDFILSSMVNSGIRNVAVFTHTKYRSLMDHIGSGREWDLARKRNGIFILPPAVEELQEMLRGDLFYFYKHRDYFYRSSQEYVVISRSHMVCNINLEDVVDFHKESKADITLVYKDDDDQNQAKCRRIQVNSEGRVTVIQDHFGRTESNKISMEIFVMKKELLLDLVETSLSEGYDHFVRNAIMKNTDRLTIYGYRYRGYLGVINTIQSYYQHSMKLLDPDVWNELFFKPGSIYTKVKDEPPTKYTPKSFVRNSLIANGCIIDGSVENCILFRGVKVGSGVHLKNSIIMQNCQISERASIENAILDKDVTVSNDTVLKGDPKAPFIAVKRKII